MIGIDPEAALEILDARAYYEARRAGLGLAFQSSVNRTLDAIDAAPTSFPAPLHVDAGHQARAPAAALALRARVHHSAAGTARVGL